jgi:uncharacterized protein YrzB (UPF0473 family)
MEKITFNTDEEGSVEFFVLEETRINGINYLLVTETDDESDEEAVAYILKDTSAAEETEAAYVMVEADDELEYVAKVFAELLEDVDNEM